VYRYPVSFLALFNFLFLLFLNSIKKIETENDIYHSEMILAIFLHTCNISLMFYG